MAIANLPTETEPSSRLELYWMPLGAGTTVGSHVVRISGAIYERLLATIHRRPARPLFHTALIAHTSEGVWAVEMTPVPRRGQPAQRGVVGGGAVGSRLLGGLRVFRYEIRRWHNGHIPDISEAVASPVVIATSADQVERVLDLLPEVPSAVWGRDPDHIGEMWNSNSVVSWTLARAGLEGRAGFRRNVDARRAGMPVSRSLAAAEGTRRARPDHRRRRDEPGGAT